MEAKEEEEIECFLNLAMENIDNHFDAQKYDEFIDQQDFDEEYESETYF